MDWEPVEKGIYDSILVVFGGAAGGIAYASLSEPVGVRLGTSFVLLGMVGILSWYMNKEWDLD